MQEEMESALAAGRSFYSLAAHGQDQISDAAQEIPEALANDLCALIRQTQSETEATIGGGSSPSHQVPFLSHVLP
jgi:ribosomal 50S subunit-associated protein YjgA (DUF615 family)